MTPALRPYQHAIAHHIVATPRCFVWAGMGLGKTVSTLTAISLIDLLDDVFPVLVIAPLRVAQSTWPAEVRKWFPEWKVEVIAGTAQQRRDALDRPAHIYTINYENLPWLVEQVGSYWFFEMVVADESSKLKGFRPRQGTKRAKALAKVAFQSPRFVGLTGTPAPNGVIDLYGQVWFADRGQRLGTTFRQFAERYFRAERIGSHPHAKRLVPLKYAQDDIQDKLADLCISVDAADHFDIDQPIVTRVSVELPPGARAQYQEMEQELYNTLHDVEAVNAAVKTIKLQQLIQGALIVGEEFAEIHNAKLDALESIIEEAAGMPVLVAYKFKADLVRLQQRFPQGRHLDKNPKTIDEWNAGRIPVLFLHPASAGHGISLQDGGNILVFFAIDWNLEERLQVAERNGPVRQAQAGYQRPVFHYYIVAEDTLDDVILSRTDDKKSILDTLLESMK